MVKKIEKRRYKIIGFRDLMDGTVRVILAPCEIVKPKKQQPTFDNIMQNPFGFAQNLMQTQMNQMIYDTFLIAETEYLNNNYKVGEIIKVTIEKERI